MFVMLLLVEFFYSNIFSRSSQVNNPLQYIDFFKKNLIYKFKLIKLQNITYHEFFKYDPCK